MTTIVLKPETPFNSDNDEPIDVPAEVKPLKKAAKTPKAPKSDIKRVVKKQPKAKFIENSKSESDEQDVGQVQLNKVIDD